MKFHALLLNALLLASSGLAWKGPRHVREALPGAVSSASASAPPAPASGSPLPATISAPQPVSSQASGPKCGKGYTYCGYMLTANGHNFATNDISKAYCNGLSELCTNGKTKTDIGQAVFVCMNDQPSNIELMCACSGKCLNDQKSNYIAHCDKPCINA